MTSACRLVRMGLLLLVVGGGVAHADEIVIRNNSDPPILQSADLVADGVRFRDKVTPRIDAANLNKGLHFVGGGSHELLCDVTANNFNDSIVLGARDATTVAFNELMTADKSNDVLLTLTTGGRIVFGDDARLDFVNESFFTRQFWVYGDGTGTLELAEGFVADRTNNGTVELGYGAIRLGQATLLTHHTQSLPEHVRPGSTAGPGINGHMVFTEQADGRWHTATNPQTYRGGVWIEQDITIHTQADLTHTGVLNTWTDFTNHGALQTLNPNVTITKTGSAALILAGEQAYQPGALIDVRQGSVVFQTPAVGGTIKNGTAGQDLAIAVADGATVRFDVSNDIRSLANEGATHLAAGAELDVLDRLTASNGSITEVVLAATDAAADYRVTVGGTLDQAGTLKILDAGDLAIGAYDLFDAATFDGSFNLSLPSGFTGAYDDQTGVLTINAVPEPSSLALLGSSLLAGLLLARRKRFDRSQR